MYEGVSPSSNARLPGDGDKVLDINKQEGQTEGISVKSDVNKKLTFCALFCLYHRCLNLYVSSYHTLKRPSRVFSFCL